MTKQRTKLLVENIQLDLAALGQASGMELVKPLAELTRIIDDELSEVIDREALLKQVQILASQALLPKEKRRKLLVGVAMYYLSAFVSVPSIGNFLVANRQAMDRFFDL